MIHVSFKDLLSIMRSFKELCLTSTVGFQEAAQGLSFSTESFLQISSFDLSLSWKFPSTRQLLKTFPHLSHSYNFITTSLCSIDFLLPSCKQYAIHSPKRAVTQCVTLEKMVWSPVLMVFS